MTDLTISNQNYSTIQRHNHSMRKAWMTFNCYKNMIWLHKTFHKDYTSFFFLNEPVTCNRKSHLSPGPCLATLAPCCLLVYLLYYSYLALNCSYFHTSTLFEVSCAVKYNNRSMFCFLRSVPVSVLRVKTALLLGQAWHVRSPKSTTGQHA